LKTIFCRTLAVLFINTIEIWAQHPRSTAANAAIGSVFAVIPDGNGNVYFTTTTPAGAFGSEVFKVNQNGILTVIAGNSMEGYSGDGGQRRLPNCVTRRA
jgi:hypothetical protein